MLATARMPRRFKTLPLCAASTGARLRKRPEISADAFCFVMDGLGPCMITEGRRLDAPARGGSRPGMTGAAYLMGAARVPDFSRNHGAAPAGGLAEPNPRME